MKIKLLMGINIALFVLLSLSTTWAIQKAVVKRSKFVDETYGYSIEFPRFPGGAANQPGIPIMVFGPMVNGFSAKANVGIIWKQMTLKSYREVATAEFKQLGLKLNSERQLKVGGRDAIEFDYEGAIEAASPRRLHFLALNVIEKDRVVSVTCTSSPESFTTNLPEFRACLDSLTFP